ncbi:hypothetical protein P3T36_006349 [Kitasatospora sp. MAP12-15]|uniref:hypothetical protein n=1 Tax=unclassified Kitasatospora TaxID=2633591 RepID=UPI002475D384|nr:hypothetical protein [Kitasatospora sp. MAP12-44]MDH6107890.1 hypothetical protein [Kitasatospora sp. MAP12-44]
MTVSAALVFTVITIILARSGRTTYSAAIVALIAGFLLASSSLAPTISNLLTSTGAALSRIV